MGNDTEYAFPNDTADGHWGPPGMELRDYFAAKVASGMKWQEMTSGDVISASARLSYAIADAMMKARKPAGAPKKTSPPPIKRMSD